MRKTIYECNQCKKEIGTRVHLSMNFGNYSGVAIPPCTKIPLWHLTETFDHVFMHFCGSVCLAKYFETKVQSAFKSYGSPKGK